MIPSTVFENVRQNQENNESETSLNCFVPSEFSENGVSSVAGHVVRIVSDRLNFFKLQFINSN